MARKEKGLMARRRIVFEKDKKSEYSAGTGMKTIYYWLGEKVTEQEYYRLERKKDFVECESCGTAYHKALRCPRCSWPPNLSDIGIALDKMKEQLNEIKELLPSKEPIMYTCGNCKNIWNTIAYANCPHCFKTRPFSQPKDLSNESKG